MKTSLFLSLVLGASLLQGQNQMADGVFAPDGRVYRQLARKGEPTPLFHCRLSIGQWEHLTRSGIEVPFGDEWVRVGSLKAFADGSLGSSTALFFEPFTSDPTTRGLPSDILLAGSLEKWGLG